MDPRPEHPRSSVLRLLAVMAGFAGTFALCALIGYDRMFSVFEDYDDEGCMLISIQQFNKGHALYDEVFSMYGPFPFLVKWALFGLIRQPVGHDIGRLICLGYWLATAGLGAAVAYRLTGSLLATWSTFLLLFAALTRIVGEPGHPQELCGLLLVAALGIATLADPGRRPRLAMIGLGVVGGCLALSKINVFIFLAMALGATMLAHTPRGRGTRALAALYAACLLAAPGLLMRTHLATAAGREFALHVTLSLVPPLILGFGVRRAAFLSARHYAWALGALGLTIGAICGATLLRGTTPRGLLEGALLNGPKLGVVFGSPAPFFSGKWPIPAAFLAGALAAVVLRRRGVVAWRPLVLAFAAFRIAFGVFLLAATWPMRAESFNTAPYERLMVLGVPAAALVLIPPAGIGRAPWESFARLFLAFLAVTEVLWAYPVAGNQLAFATFLCVLAAVVVVHDASAAIAALTTTRERTGAWVLPRVARASVVATLLLGALIEADAAHDRYRSRAPLALPGARRVRLERRQVERLRAVTAALRDRADTFIAMPGLHSFYFWTGQEPPTSLNLTNWMYLLDDRQQARIARQLCRSRRPCVLVNPRLVVFWLRGMPLAPTPLVRTIEDQFEPAVRVGDDLIWVRKPRSRVGP